MSEREFNVIALAATPSLAFYLGVIAVAIVAPRVAAFGYLVVAVVAVLRTRGDKTQPVTSTPT